MVGVASVCGGVYVVVAAVCRPRGWLARRASHSRHDQINVHWTYVYGCVHKVAQSDRGSDAYMYITGFRMTFTNAPVQRKLVTKLASYRDVTSGINLLQRPEWY